jgi:hypothetical protein
MAHISVTTTDNTFKVDFNDLAGIDMDGIGVIPLKHTYQKINVEFTLEADKVLAILISYSRQYAVSFNGSAGTMQISTVNGVAPTSNLDLYNLLDALLG